MVYHISYHSGHSDRVLAIEAQNFTEACKIAAENAKPHETIQAVFSSKSKLYRGLHAIVGNPS